MLTLRPNINQLPGNREKKRDRGEEEGHQSMVHILRDAGAEKVCMPGFCMCVCVCVLCGWVESIIQQPTHKWGGHEEIIAGAHTH